MKDIAGQEGHKQEALDGVGVVLVDVIDMPAIDQFIKPMVLDIPSLVAEADGRPQWRRVGREAWSPKSNRWFAGRLCRRVAGARNAFPGNG